jgi:hypothetical protein
MSVPALIFGFLFASSVTLNLVFIFIILPIKNGHIRQLENAVIFYLRKLRAVYNDGFWMGWEWLFRKWRERN